MKLGITNHAVERYVERVKPALGLDAARRELLALLDAAPRLPRVPTGTTCPNPPIRRPTST